MRIYLLFLGYIFGLLLLAAALVPWAHPALFAHLGLEPASSLYRLAMLVALLALPWFLQRIRLNSWEAAGFTAPRTEGWRQLGLGFLAGCAILAVLAVAETLTGMHHLAIPASKATAAYVAKTIVSGALSGLAVGLIEETFFRGLMQTGLRRSMAFWPSALLIATLYAALHFVKPEPLGDNPFDHAHAFSMLFGGFARLTEASVFADSLTTLFVAGVFFCMIRERTGSVVWAIGIHAGWVMSIKLFKYLTDPTLVDGAPSPWIAGGYDHVTGWLATLWLSAVAWIYWHISSPAIRMASDTHQTGW